MATKQNNTYYSISVTDFIYEYIYDLYMFCSEELQLLGIVIYPVNISRDTSVDRRCIALATRDYTPRYNTNQFSASVRLFFDQWATGIALKDTLEEYVG